jgi:hypothetical protein
MSPMFDEQTDHMIILVVSAIAAMVSFVALALPYLNRNEKKEHYKTVIEKKRKALFEQTKESVATRGQNKGDKSLSAKETFAFIFTVQKLFGQLGEKVRDQMLQAGIRDPKAPFKYLMARAMIPAVSYHIHMAGDGLRSKGIYASSSDVGGWYHGGRWILPAAYLD